MAASRACRTSSACCACRSACRVTTGNNLRRRRSRAIRAFCNQGPPCARPTTPARAAARTRGTTFARAAQLVNRSPPYPTQSERRAEGTRAEPGGPPVAGEDPHDHGRRGGRARGRLGRTRTPRPLAGGEDGGQVRGPDQPRLPRPSIAGGPPVAGENPGRSFPRRGWARRGGEPGSAPRPPPSTRSTALSPARGTRRGSRPGSRPAPGGGGPRLT